MIGGYTISFYIVVEITAVGEATQIYGRPVHGDNFRNEVVTGP